jgi:hypothetical protein
MTRVFAVAIYDHKLARFAEAAGQWVRLDDLMDY